MLTLRWGERVAGPCVLVMGGFDGLHIGHRELLADAKKEGLPVALTTMFGGKGKALFTREERREIFARAGVDILFEIDLGGEVRRTPAERFARDLFASADVRAVVCGEDFRFGRDALGTPELIKRCAVCPVFIHETVKYFAEESGRARKVSTSACKALLKAGNLPALDACLCGRGGELYGGAYFVQGRVEHGREVGRTYGFPTLNLTPPPEKLLPPDGVYGGLCETPAGTFPTIVNFGARPTFGVGERKTEAYLDGFSGDLYGQTVRVYPLGFYRGIEKFPSAAALKEQLQRDIARLRGEHL